MNKNILILGASGQDGSLMSDYLLANTKYNIFGGIRRLSVPNHTNLKEAIKNDRFKLVTIDLTDSSSVDEAVKKIMPDYLINFAANSFVGCSWDMPMQVLDVNTGGVIRCLEAIRKYKPSCRFYSAGSSEEMGDVFYSPQDLKHPIRPRSPYGASKAAARHYVKCYRESYGLYAVHGILYNHESERRGEEFVTRKITKGVARIKRALELNKPFEPVELGNLDAKRDWSHASDFVDGIWRMLNQEIHNSESLNWGWVRGAILTQEDLSKNIKDYILASGETHSIREFVELAFDTAGIEGWWIGPVPSTKEEIYVHKPNGVLVSVNPKFYRPADVETLCGNSTLAREELGWRPKVSFEELVRRMVNADLKITRDALNV